MEYFIVSIADQVSIIIVEISFNTLQEKRFILLVSFYLLLIAFHEE